MVDDFTIRKIDTATGNVTTLAGCAYATGDADGTGAEAEFYFPIGVAADSAALYVTDAMNGAIRRVAIDTGKVTTLAGRAAGLNGPGSIAADGRNLYVLDSGSLRKVAISTGAVTTIADGFQEEASVTTDGTYLYVTNGSEIKQISGY